MKNPLSQGNMSKDFLASVVVFLVALPLCMGIAIASGVPPALGLITGIVGGLIVGSFSGSPLLVSGPAAGLAVIVYQFVQEYGLPALGIALLMAGGIQAVAGVFRLGRWFRAISPSVIHGMLAGIGVLIFASQFHVMVDDSPRGSGIENLISIPMAIYKGVFPVDGSVHHQAAMVGVLTILTLLLWNRFKPERLKFIPGPLAAIVVATGATTLLAIPIQRVTIPNNLGDAVTLPSLELFALAYEMDFMISVFALAFIASAETLLSAAAVDQMHQGPSTDYDRELTAQGVGNMICGALGALPMTGVIVRSGANVQAGAQTRLSTILHAVWLVAFVAAFPGILGLIPTAGLAAILVYTGFKLVDTSHLRKLAQYGRTEVFIYLTTVVAIVATDLIRGIVLGLVLALIKLLYTLSHLNVDCQHEPSSRRVDMKLEGSATFVRLPKLATTLDGVPKGTELHVCIENLDYIDHACIDLLASWEARQNGSGGRLIVDWSELNHRYHTKNASPEAVISISKTQEQTNRML